MSSKPDAGAEDEPPQETEANPGWTSLEKWKLATAAATPLAIFVLGVVVSRSDAARDDAIRNEIHVRDDGIRKDAIAREDVLRTRSELAAENARRAAAVSEENIRREALARDDQIRQEAAAREDALRDDEIRRARYTRLVDRRVAGWDRLGPLVTSLQNRMKTGLLEEEFDTPQIDDLIDQANAAMNTLGPFFSREFIRAYSQFMYEVENYRGIWRGGRARLGARGPYADLRRQGNRVREGYERLRLMAARDLQAVTPASGQPVRVIGADHIDRWPSGE